jgi:hypothetical protein
MKGKREGGGDREEEKEERGGKGGKGGKGKTARKEGRGRTDVGISVRTLAFSDEIFSRCLISLPRFSKSEQTWTICVMLRLRGTKTAYESGWATAPTWRYTRLAVRRSSRRSP